MISEWELIQLITHKHPYFFAHLFLLSHGNGGENDRQ